MTDHSSNLTPEQRLEAMTAMYRARMGMRIDSAKTLARRDFMALEAVALDLLARLDAAEAPGTADALKRCVWTKVGNGAHETSCFLVTGAPPLKFCPGCGHPVQVKQKEDSHD